MGSPLRVAPGSVWFRHIGKGVAVAASTGAALVSIVSALFSYGVIGRSQAHQAIGNMGAAWVTLRPAAETAFAVGDTVRFAATIADRNGSILIGAHPTWTTGDSTVATVEQDGAVVSRGTGITTVSVVVGSLVAQSRVHVRPRVAGVIVSSASGDSNAVVPEGGQLQLQARAVDARGHTVMQSGAEWHIDDTTVAALDSRGVMTGIVAGRSVVSVRMQGAAGYLPIAVVTKPSALTAVAGAGQRALAGGSLPQAIVVRATSRRGAGVGGKLVRFRTADGRGTVRPDSVLTDADGRARATWTLADYPGRQTLLAMVQELDSTVAIVAESDPVAANTRVTPLATQFDAVVGEVLTDSVAVRVTDSTGRSLPDVPVQWSVLGRGTVEALDARTDTLGIARARWTLAGHTGHQRLRAQLARGIPPVTIEADVRAGAAALVKLVDGDRQRGSVGAALRKPLVIQVLDAEGNGVSGARVVLSPSGGAIADSTMTTAAAGLARISWKLGRAAGGYTLGVHVDGVKAPLKLSAHASPLSPANIAFEELPAARGTRANAKRLSAIVTDVFGNPVPDAPVTFSSKAGTVTPARAVTDAKGRVTLRWIPGSASGEQRLRGVVRGTDVSGWYVAQAARPARSPRAGRN